MTTAPTAHAIFEIKSHGTKNPKRDSVSSFTFDINSLHAHEFRTEFYFINWVGYPIDRVLHISVFTTKEHPTMNTKVALIRETTDGKFTTLHFTRDDTKQMSIVEFSTNNPFHIIETLINGGSEDSEHEFVYMKMLTPTKEQVLEYKREGFYCNWGITVHELIYSNGFAARADFPTDIPKYGPLYYHPK